MLERLSDAVQLIKSGNKQAALPILEEVIGENPENEDAWLWLYYCLDEIQEKKYCLEQALKINPENQQARKALAKLTTPAPQPVQQSVLQKTNPDGFTAIESKPVKRGNRIRSSILGIVGIMLLCLCACPVMYVASPGLYQPMIVTLFPMPTQGTSTPFVLLTPAAFKPGNPTATPIGSEITDPDFINGVTAYHNKQYELVINLMTKVIQAHPQLAPAYRHRGMAYWYLNRCRDAWPDVKKALSLDPNYASAWAARGVVNLCAGEQQEARSDFYKALSLDGSLAVAHHNLGQIYYEMGQYQKSADEYDMAAAIDKSRAEAWLGGGDAYYELQQYEKAIVDYKEAAALLSGNAHVYCQLAYSYFETHQYQNTLDAAKSSIAIDPACGGHQLIVIQARSADALGNYTDALVYINKAIAKNSDKLDYYYRGIIFQNSGNKAEAIKDFKYFLTTSYVGTDFAIDAQTRLAQLQP